LPEIALADLFSLSGRVKSELAGLLLSQGSFKMSWDAGIESLPNTSPLLPFSTKYPAAKSVSTAAMTKYRNNQKKELVVKFFRLAHLFLITSRI
jgi:hypothetical protein